MQYNFYAVLLLVFSVYIYLFVYKQISRKDLSCERIMKRSYYVKLDRVNFAFRTLYLL